MTTKNQQVEKPDQQDYQRFCPRCNASDVRRSWAHSHDDLFRKLFYRAYRCRICHFRFWQVAPLKVGLFTVVIGPAFVLTVLWAGTSDRPILETSAESQAVRETKTGPAQGDTEAELQMGIRYSLGDGVVKNPKEAVNWFEKAASHGSAEAQYRYGLALQDGHGVLQDYKASLHWIEQAAQQGHARAQYSFGQMYRAGIGAEVDKARAYLWFNLAAAQGVGEAASARDSLVWQLETEQIKSLQEESRRISQMIAEKESVNQPSSIK
ncbi:MAG: tetratricopeptide repeat protein [Methylococcales bacterium]|nr:sel1 repeat family protein [Methylococcaceae bacterium]